MSSIKFSSFGAATMPLSKVVVDKELDMAGHNISGVDTLQADTLQANRVDSPYLPQAWPTEQLAWDDVTEQVAVAERTDAYPHEGLTTELITATEDMEVTIKIVATAGQYIRGGAPIKVDGVTVDSTHLQLSVIETTNPAFAHEYTSKPLMLKTGSLVTFTAETVSTGAVTTTLRCTVTNTGREVGEKTFDLSGKWLALGIDTEGLAATVKIQGVEMPYSDYAKYFPIAPTELKIPGDWTPEQIRPVIEVYA